MASTGAPVWEGCEEERVAADGSDGNRSLSGRCLAANVDDAMGMMLQRVWLGEVKSKVVVNTEEEKHGADIGSVHRHRHTLGFCPGSPTTRAGRWPADLMGGVGL